MNNPIKEIVRFNKEAGLLDRPYDDFLESAFQVEEALEGFDNHYLATQVGSPIGSSPKEISRVIIKQSFIPQEGLADVDRLDKACDSIVYAVGSIAKLGLSPQQITTALNIVMKKNFEKIGCKKDIAGKLGKPQDFIGPEAELQALLDTRQ